MAGLIANIVTVYNSLAKFSLRATIGWTGLENCGNLLSYPSDVGNSGTTLFGYRDPTDGVSSFGTLPNNIIAGTVLYAWHVDTATNICQLRFGNGFQKIQERDSVTITWQGYPTITYLWDGTNLDYRVVDVGLTNWIAPLDGQRVSFDPEYIAIMAIVDGTTALQRAVVDVEEADEVTISMWVWRDSGVNVSQKIYDIGDGITPGNDTSRMRFSPTGGLKSIVSNVVAGTYSEVASVTAPLDSTEDTLHHLFMTAKNDLVDGVGTQVMYLYEDDVLLDTSTTFLPTASTKFSFVAGELVTLFARHDLAQFLTGRVADAWSARKFMDPATAIPLFRKVSPADVAYNGGVPVELPTNGVVLGITPKNWLGGKDYSIADWNNGINNGTNGDFVRIGGIIN